VRAAGAGWVETIRFAILPQVLPGFASYALLRFEINVRASAILGFVGAGGIGQELYLVIRQFIYQDVSAIVLLIIATVALIVILFRDGLEVEYEMLQTAWRLPVRKLALGMPITGALIAVATHAAAGNSIRMLSRNSVWTIASAAFTFRVSASASGPTPMLMPALRAARK